MRNCLIVIVAIVLVIVVGYGFWVQHPPLRHPQLLQQALQDAEQRFEADLTQAHDPELNGFLAPDFVVCWGRKDREFVDKSKTATIIKAWNVGFSSAFESEPVDFQSIGPEHQKIRRDFEEIVPALLAAMNKPLFLAPESRPSHSNMIPNLINFRACAQAVSGYAELCAFEGRSQEAIDALNALANLGKSSARHNMVITERIAALIHALHFDTCTAAFTPESSLEPEEWKMLSEACFDTLPPKNQFYLAAQGEVLQLENTFEEFSQGNFTAWGQPGLVHRFPGIMARERRIHLNNTTDVLKALSQGQVYLPPNITSSTTAMLSGQIGLMSPIETIDTDHSTAMVLRITRRRMLGLGLATAILAHKARHGSYPASLVDLSLEGAEWTEPAASYQVTTEGATLKLPLEPGDDQAYIIGSRLGHARSWAKTEPGNLVFEL